MAEESQESKESPTEETQDLDPDFKNEIAQQPGGENILRCYQCGTCAGICPIFEVDESYDPQKIIKMALLGMKDEVLSSELIWLCSTCYGCYEHCPQDVKFTDLMCAIQNLATKYGYLAPALSDKIKLLKEHARTLPMDNFDNKKRGKMELPTIEEHPDDTCKLLENTGIEEIVAAGTPPPEATPEEEAESPQEETTESEPATQEPALNETEKETEGEE
jgi:heterodisulfide reductase subunit C